MRQVSFEAEMNKIRAYIFCGQILMVYFYLATCQVTKFFLEFNVGELSPTEFWQRRTEKTIFPFPFTLTGIWSRWQFSFDFEPNWVQFGSKSKENLSPRSYLIQYERKLKPNFLSPNYTEFWRQQYHYILCLSCKHTVPDASKCNIVTKKRREIKKIFELKFHDHYEWAKRTKFLLLSEIYGSPRWHSNISKTLKNISEYI